MTDREWGGLGRCGLSSDVQRRSEAGACNCLSATCGERRENGRDRRWLGRAYQVLNV